MTRETDSMGKRLLDTQSYFERQTPKVLPTSLLTGLVESLRQSENILVDPRE